MKVKNLSLTVFLVLALLVGCTENLFFDDDENAKDKHSVSGKILLSDGTEPGDIYVWISGINLSAWTNKNGDFQILIPKTDEFAGINGEFTVYFYVANYEYATAQAMIRGGEFVYGDKDITGDGKIKEINTLHKLLHINTDIKPDVLSPEKDGLVTINIEVSTIDLPVSIVTNQTKDRVFGCFALVPDDKPLSESVLLDLDQLQTFADNIEGTVRWQTRMIVNYDSLELGHYSVRPYIKIRQDGLPFNLTASFGKDAHKFSYDYLEIPFKQDVGRIEVR